ncbi:MAG: uroporphyrinogen-III C-methyltransferase [bacterium]
MKKGKVYLIGAGPGDPGLITVKGLEILKQAEVVIYDYLVDKTILKYASPTAELICADELDRERFSINKIMVKKAKAGKRVARLKNGDPFVFGRANEEIEALSKNRIEFSVIPGVTAANAASCFSGIPLTARGVSSNVVFATGHEDPKKNKGFINWKNIAQADTIVLYMAVENLPQITQKLLVSGKKINTPAAVISDVSRIGQKIVTGVLKDISNKTKAEKISAPAIVIIGDVVKKERNFNWFGKNRKILFTGLSSERFFEKGIIFHLPMIEIKPLNDYNEMDKWIKKINTFDWIVFSSRFGALYFFRRLLGQGFDTRVLNGIKIAAIGNSTAGKLREYGIIADIIPKQESSSGLLGELRKLNIAGAKIFLPRSDIADKGLTEGLKKFDAVVYSCVAYRNVMPENLPDMDFDFFDEIIFSSPSAGRNLIKRYGKPPERIRIRAIGSVTGKELKKWGLSA